jgi:hypothetical protein
MTRLPQRSGVEACESPLPLERAFVLQIRPQMGAGDQLFVGRIEHIVSGAAERFTSTAEVIAFVTRVLLPATKEEQ